MANKVTVEIPWERQQGESSQAYEAFQKYRDMGGKRTQTAVAKELGKSVTLINRWAAKYGWKSRALSYDNYLEKEALREATKQARSMRARHIKLAMFLQKMAADKLEKIKIDEIDIKDIRLLLKDGIEIERMSRAEETAAARDAVTTAEAGETTGNTGTLADAIMGAYSRRRGSSDEN